MTDQLADLIRFASAQVEVIFAKTGSIHPMYDATKTNGERLIVPAPCSDKDTSVALIKALFALEGVDRYVYMDEAWILDQRNGGPPLELEKIRREGIVNHPDRREIVLFSAENRRGEMLTAKRYILRPEHGKARLSPLAIDPPFDHSEGRMVGLLKEVP